MSSKTDFLWYLIINKAVFEGLDLTSREVEVILQGVGLKTVLVTKGEIVSIVYEGVMLSPGMADENPFYFDGYAAFLDSSDDIYLGIPVT